MGSHESMQHGDQPEENVRILVLCGASGTGKTVTLWDIGHQLERLDVRHALIDTDELDRVWPRPEPLDPLISVSQDHLQAMWRTFYGLGIRNLVLCGVMESISQSSAWIGRAIPGATITFVRLRAQRTTREERLRGREVGSGFDHEMSASDRANQFMRDHDRPELLFVHTDSETVAEIAEKVLRAAGWID